MRNPGKDRDALPSGLPGDWQRPETASLLHVAVNRHQRRLRAAFAAFLKRHSGLTLPEWRVLAVLAELGRLVQKDIVSATFMEQAQVSKALSRLREAGMVTDSPNPGDGRMRLYRLSAAGRSEVDRLRPVMVTRRDRIDATLPDAERAVFLAALERIAAAAEAAVADAGADTALTTPK